MPETLYLIDAYAQIFRAYYAIRGGMRGPSGEPTHAVFGFAGMLLKLFTQFQPHYVAVAVDAPGRTFRDDLYAEYKGTRRATPDDLSAQIPRVFELIEHFGIPMIGVPGLEADDVIACITTRILNDPAASDVHVRLVSKDKDLEQLLCDRVSLFDIHTDTTLDAAGLLASKGITPAQVVDYLALIGDNVDNVPGVEGIGPKTAAQLIQQYGSIEGIYACIDQITGKRRENLEKARAHLPLSRTLVTLQCHHEFPFSLEDARVRPPDLDRLIPFFQQLGFRRYQDEVRRLAAAQAAGEPAGPPADASALGSSPLPPPAGPLAAYAQGEADYRVLRSESEVLHALEEAARHPLVSVDTETTGLGRDAALCGLSLSWHPGQGVYIPTRSPEPDTHLSTERALHLLRPLLEDPGVSKCGHNVKFDAAALLRSGVRLRGVCFDSLLASALLDPGLAAHKLDLLAERALGYRMIPITDLIGAGPDQATMDQVPLSAIGPYAAEDADIALRLAGSLQPTLESAGMSRLLREVEAPLAVVLAEMEHAGILCDPDELLRQGRILQARVDELRQEIHRVCGFEFQIESTRQLAEALFDRLGLKSVKKTKTGRSTDIEVLEKLAAEEDLNDPRTSVPRLLIEYRQLTKLIGTYLGNLRASIDPRTGRIHSTFHQLVTATGRLASHNPNLQNIPVRTEVGRQIRKAFPAPPGQCLICADYSQIELRILAHCSGDAALVEAFEKDEDVHAAVASQVFGVPPGSVTREQRSSAKTINFGIIYGVTPYGLARRVEGLDVPAATRLIADYKARFPGIDRFLQECVDQASSQGWVATLMGRRRAIPEIYSTNHNQRSLGERLAINSVIQGTAADLIKAAMVRVHRRIDRDSVPLRLLLQIHDELVFEAPRESAEGLARCVREEMESAMELRVPLRAECGWGSDWMSAK